MVAAATRFSLGAGWWLARLDGLMTATLTALLAGLAAALFLIWLDPMFRLSLYDQDAVEIPRTLTPATRLTVLLTIAALAAASAGALALLPTAAMMTALKEGGTRGLSGRLWRQGLTRRIAQLVVGVSAMMAALGVATYASVERLLTSASGVSAKDIIVAKLDVPGGFKDVARGAEYIDRVQSAVADRSGVQAVGWAASPPGGTHSEVILRRVDDGQHIVAAVNAVSPDYFTVIGASLRAGRLFARVESEAPNVVVVNAQLGALLNGDPVGQRIAAENGRVLTVVGVVESGVFRTMRSLPPPTLYRPLAQYYTPRLALLVRATGDRGDALVVVQQALTNVPRRAFLHFVSGLDDYLLRTSLSVEKISRALMLFAALIGLVLGSACVGVVMHELAVTRRSEFALRLALGAQRRHVVRQLIKDSLNLLLPATSVGLAGGIALVHAVGVGDFNSPTTLYAGLCGGISLPMGVVASICAGIRPAMAARPLELLKRL
jgi:hypothetical protein